MLWIKKSNRVNNLLHPTMMVTHYAVNTDEVHQLVFFKSLYSSRGWKRRRESTWSQGERRAADRWGEGFSRGRSRENMGLWWPYD